MKKHLIFGVHITNRVKRVPEIQKVLTEFGCSIKTRLGLHEADAKVCSPNGLIILEMVGEIRRPTGWRGSSGRLRGSKCRRCSSRILEPAGRLLSAGFQGAFLGT